jgi:phosphopantetheinyl transferase (holo-ACP synthase)
MSSTYLASHATSATIGSQGAFSVLQNCRIISHFQRKIMEGGFAFSVSGRLASFVRRSVSSLLNNSRWAVKEAVYKAVYPIVKPTWHDFTLKRPVGSPKPDLVYHPKDSQLSRRLGRMHTSVSHDGEYTFATVIVETPANHNTI